MTSFLTTAYNQVDFMPSQIFQDVSKVCWDGTRPRSVGEWFSVTIVSEKDFQTDTSQAGVRSGIDVTDFPNNAGSLFYDLPGFGPGAADGGKELPPTGFMMTSLEGSTAVYNGQDHQDINYQGFRTGTDKATRFPWCMTDLPDGRIRIDIGRDPTPRSSRSSRRRPGTPRASSPMAPCE